MSYSALARAAAQAKAVRCSLGSHVCRQHDQHCYGQLDACRSWINVKVAAALMNQDESMCSLISLCVLELGSGKIAAGDFINDRTCNGIPYVLVASSQQPFCQQSIPRSRALCVVSSHTVSIVSSHVVVSMVSNSLRYNSLVNSQ